MGKDNIGGDASHIEVIHSYTLCVPKKEMPQGNRVKGLAALTSKYGSRVVQAKEDLCCTMYFEDINYMFAGREDGTVAMWGLKSERAKGDCRFLRAHKGPVTCLLALERKDGETGAGLMLSGSADSCIKIWDPMLADRDGCCVQTLGGHGGTVTSLARCRDYLFSSSTDRTVRIWKAADGRQSTLYPWFDLHKTLATFDGWVHSLCFDQTHKVGDLGSLFAADSTGAVARFNPRPGGASRGSLEFDPINNTGKAILHAQASSAPPLVFRRLHDRGISHVRFLAEQYMVLTLAYDNKARVYDVRTGQCLMVIDNPHECNFTDIDWDPVHDQVLLSDKLGFLFVYDMQAEGLVFKKRLNSLPLLSIIFNPKNDEVAVTTKEAVEFWKLEREIDYHALPGGHTGPILAVQVANVTNGVDDTERFIFSASLDNTIRLWDPHDMTCLRVLTEDRSEISVMVFSEGKNVLVTGHDNGCIRIWNLDTGSTINLTEHSNTVSCIATATLKKGEEFIMTGGFDGKVGVWDVRKRLSVRPHLVTMFEAHPASEVLCLLHDPYQGTIVTAGNDTVIKVWSASAYELIGEMTGHTEAVTALALDANFLFSASEDFTIRVWDSTSRQHIKTLEAHTRPVTAVSIIEETGHLLSCSLDGSLLVWDYSSGSILKKSVHREELRCLAFRPDTKEVLIGTMQDNILVFPLPEELFKVRESDFDLEEGGAANRTEGPIDPLKDADIVPSGMRAPSPALAKDNSMGTVSLLAQS